MSLIVNEQGVGRVLVYLQRSATSHGRAAGRRTLLADPLVLEDVNHEISFGRIFKAKVPVKLPLRSRSVGMRRIDEVDNVFGPLYNARASGESVGKPRLIRVLIRRERGQPIGVIRLREHRTG